MMVPTSFRYSGAPPMEATWDKKSAVRQAKPLRNVRQTRQITSAPRPIPPPRTTSEPVRTPAQPVPVPTVEREHSPKGQDMPKVDRTPVTIRRKPANHDPNALPPAVAALLAVTEIPRPKRSQFHRRRSAQPRRISLEQLVSEWKSDESLLSSYGSSGGLSILLEDPDGTEENGPTPAESLPEDFLYKRSVSAESVPSLEADDRSLLSSESVSTPGSIRSRRSFQNLKSVSRSLPASEKCDLDHPLVPSQEDPEDALILEILSASKVKPLKVKAGFTSNLTSSLQALKNAAISSISSFTTSNAPGQQPDDALWSHPYLFPRLSSEMRPAITGTPTKEQRRYLNPTRPLTFDDLAGPYQDAFHAPFLAEELKKEADKKAPSIQMRKIDPRTHKFQRRSLSPPTELGRVLLGSPGLRQREIRENSGFMRMLACELNMKRSGKLKYAKTKILRPPRQVNTWAEEPKDEKVPRRWVGESAY